MKVTFFGHRRLENREEVRIWLEPTVARLAACGARTFYLGGYGEFDRLALRAVRAARRAHPEVEAVLVLAYPEAGADAAQYDATVYPPLERVPRRYAIARRNQWMADEAAVVVACVQHGWGGAAKALEYARKKGKEVVAYGTSRKEGHEKAARGCRRAAD